MGKEAYTVNFDKANYHAPVPAGDKQDVFKGRERDIRDGMLRYLSEYRLGVRFDEFFYRKERDLLTGEVHFAANESGPVRNKFYKAIREKERNGLSGRREIAECLGFKKLEDKLTENSEDSLFIWVSPPGPKAEGYGDYSFTFVGQAVRDQSTGEEKIRVVPYRNILSQEEHRNYLKYFDRKAESFKTDVDFLSNPVIFPPTEEIKSPEDLLRFIGEKESISMEWSKRLLNEVGPLVERYISQVKSGASDKDLIKTRNAIENFTIAVRNRIIGRNYLVNEGPVSNEDLDNAIEIYGNYEPPEVAGSCGSTSKTLMEFQEESGKSWEYHSGSCVNCGAEDVMVGPCNICKKCEKEFDKKEKAARG